MKLLINNIESIKHLSGFAEIHEYSDKHINRLYNNYIFLYEYHNTILSLNDISQKCILYSEYYWGAMFINAYRKKYDKDSGLEQFHFKLIERIEHTLGNVDIILLEKIELAVSSNHFP